MRQLKSVLSVCAMVVLFTACSGSNNPTSPTGEAPGSLRPAVFTASPLRLEDITEIISIGNLAPPGHTLPTEHAYFFFAKDYRPGAMLPRLPVYAPASGTVTRTMVMDHSNSFRVDVEINSWLSYYLILIDLDPAEFRPGRRVTAGEQIGVTFGGANTLDIGVVNRRLERKRFARPERYSMGDTHWIDSPFHYFEEPLRGQIYARVNREGADRDGTLEVDVVGTLAGAWYRDYVPVNATGSAAWSHALVFAPDVRQPSQMRVSIGEGFSIDGLYGVQPDAVPFASVTPQSGAVGYRLDAMDNSAFPWRGMLMVRLSGPTTLEVEFFPHSTNPNESFTGAQTLYVR
jgi:hypothetical protein